MSVNTVNSKSVLLGTLTGYVCPGWEGIQAGFAVSGLHLLMSLKG